MQYNEITLTFYTFSHLKRPPVGKMLKNKKKCKINSRNFTYDGLTFSSSLFLLEDVKNIMGVLNEKKYKLDKISLKPPCGKNIRI